MATDATGTPSTNYLIPKYLTSADAPSGKGLNAIVDNIDTLLKTKFPGFASAITGTPSSTTFLRGDGSWQSVGNTAGCYVPIADTILSTTAANIDITSIPQTYQHLRLVIHSRGDIAANQTGVFIQFNGDVGANYDRQFIAGNAATASAGETFASTSAQIGQTSGSTAPANAAGFVVADIPAYTETTFHKGFLSTSGEKIATTTTGLQVHTFAGFWRSTAAVNRITLIPGSGNFVAGTHVTLYGLLTTSPGTSTNVLTPPAITTVLPVSPVDQQQAILTDSTSVPSYAWLMQWSTGAAKWFFVGGSQLYNNVETSQSPGSTGAFVDLATVGPSFVVPRSGTYQITGGFSNSDPTNPATAQFFSVNGAAVIGLPILGATNTAGSQSSASNARTQVITGLTAGDTIKLRYNSGSLTTVFVSRWLTAAPVWVT